MNGAKLHEWRRERKISQVELAKHLGIHRNTLVNWERGHHRSVILPAEVQEKLDALARSLMPKLVPQDPDFITGKNTPSLYKRAGDGFSPKGNHPRSLMWNGFLNPVDLGMEGEPKGPIPYSVLTHSAYLEALTRWEASGKKTSTDKYG